MGKGIDEAHKMMDAAEQMYGVLIIENEIQKLMKQVMPWNTKKKEQRELKNRCNEVMAINQMLFDELIEQIPDNSYSEDTDRYPTFITARWDQHLRKMSSHFHEICKMISNREKFLLTVCFMWQSICHIRM